MKHHQYLLTHGRKFFTTKNPPQRHTGDDPSNDVKRERSKVISRFSDFLCPSKEYSKTGNELANNIIKICQGMKNYKICRPTVGGSIGKKTALPDQFSSDFDIILMFNNIDSMHIDPINMVLPDSTKVKKEVAKIINEIEKTVRAELAKDPTLKILKVSSSNICLKIQVKKDNNLYSFDILPAHDFHSIVKSGEVPAEEHLKKAINSIVFIYDNDLVRFNNLSRYYSSCFSEAALEFVKKQTAFTNQNIRLGKLWLRQIQMKLDKDIFGLTFLVELVSIHVARSEEKKKSNDIAGYNAFVQFLYCLKSFKTLEIKFEDNYKIEKVPEAILQELPLVLDPTNPTNNIAKHISKEVQEFISNEAETTLDHLKNNFDQFIKKIPGFFLQLLFKE